MKPSELRYLKRMYNLELERLNRIKQLISEENVQEFLLLTELNAKDFININNNEVLRQLIYKMNITQTNGIYIYTDAYSYHFYHYDEFDSTIFDHRFGPYIRKEPFDSKLIDYKYYYDIETGNEIKACVRQELFTKYGDNILSANFEKNNIVLNPTNSFDNRNNYDEVRMEFFKNALEYGQAKSKKLILEKYPRI